MKNIHPLAEQLGLQVLDTTVHFAVKTDRLRFAWIGLVDREHARVVPVTHAGHEYGYLDDLYIDLDKGTAWGRGPAGRAGREGRPATTYDLARDPDMWPWLVEARSRGYRSAASLPIRRGGVVEAVLSLYAADAAHFDVVQTLRWKHIADGIGRTLDRIDAVTGT